MQSRMAYDAPPAPPPLRSMHALLRSMGVLDYEPRVLHQLLEFVQHYSTDIFADSLHFAEHGGRPGHLESEDVLLSVRLREKAAQATAPQLMDWMAKTRNRHTIEPPTVPNVQLPSAKLCLVEENWQYLPTPPAPPPEEEGGQVAGGQGPGAQGRSARPSGSKIAIRLSGPEPMNVDKP